MPRILHQTRQQRARRAAAYSAILDRIFRPAPNPQPPDARFHPEACLRKRCRLLRRHSIARGPAIS